MNIYIDESGSINNRNPRSPYFVISMICCEYVQKLKRVYQRFIAKNLEKLRELDEDRYNDNGKLIKAGHKMFSNGKFVELKGSMLDRQTKKEFVEFCTQKKRFEVFYIVIDNEKLSDKFCSNKARAFNYTLKLALDSFLSNSLLPNEPINLMIDERNERTETRYFLEEYLNVELTMQKDYSGPFTVKYFDSQNNKGIQIADFFANFYFSHLFGNTFSEEIKKLQDANILVSIFEFPYQPLTKLK